MTVAVLALIVFVLGVALMWSSIINRQTEAALNKTKLTITKLDVQKIYQEIFK